MNSVHPDSGDVLEIITQRVHGDMPSAPDDPSTATYRQRVFLNGREVKGALRSRVLTGADFTTVVLRILPGHLIVRDVDALEWDTYEGELGLR